MGGTFLSHSRHAKVLRSPGEDMFADFLGEIAGVEAEPSKEEEEEEEEVKEE